MTAARAKQRAKDRRRHLAELGLPRRCPVLCPCICHDTQGGYHDHEGRPCPGKAARS